MRSFEWAIEDIVAAYPLLCMDDHAAMAVSLMNLAERSAGLLVNIDGFDIAELEGERQFTLNMTWTVATAAKAERLKRTKQRSPIIEGAAVAVAALLFAHLIRDSTLEVTTIGDSADFGLPRIHQAVEVSGTASIDQMARRRREKKRQMLENSHGWDGFVVLCCFAEPDRVIQWFHYSQE